MMSKSFSTTAMALLIAAAVPTSVHGFTTATSPFTTASSVRSASALMAVPRRVHTVVNKNQNAAQSVFAKIDTDGNGKIDKKELLQYLTSEGPYTTAVAQSIFERLDANQDGHLVLAELVTGMKEHHLFGAIATSKSKEQPTKKINVVANPKNTFAVVQKPMANNDGKKASMKQWRSRVEQKANKFFQMIDADRDGSISITELKEHFLVKRMQAVAKSSGLLASLRSSDDVTTETSSSSSKKASDVPWHHSETAIQTLYQTLDVNSDGRITSEDLRKAFVQYPSVRHAFQV